MQFCCLLFCRVSVRVDWIWRNGETYHYPNDLRIMILPSQDPHSTAWSIMEKKYNLGKKTNSLCTRMSLTRTLNYQSKYFAQNKRREKFADSFRFCALPRSNFRRGGSLRQYFFSQLDLVVQYIELVQYMYSIVRHGPALALILRPFRDRPDYASLL